MDCFNTYKYILMIWLTQRCILLIHIVGLTRNREGEKADINTQRCTQLLNWSRLHKWVQSCFHAAVMTINRQHMRLIIVLHFCWKMLSNEHDVVLSITNCETGEKRMSWSQIPIYRHAIEIIFLWSWQGCSPMSQS